VDEYSAKYAAEDARRLLELNYKEAWEDLDEEAQANTPLRFVKMLSQMLSPVVDWNFTTFDSDLDNMVTIGPIPFYTLCKHHIVPFYGNAWIGYVPNGKMAGLSKFARTVDALTKGLHVQEELTVKIAKFIEEKLEPKGVAVVMKAEHLCMAMRGAKVAGAKTTTSEMRGVFADHERLARSEFLAFIKESV
jgi:GTP cyclohydrolase I